MRDHKIIWICLSIFILASCGSKQPSAPATHIPPGSESGLQTSAEAPEGHPQISAARQIIVQTAIDNIGRPYRWGGRHPGQGFDCSGLTSYAYGKAYIPIPRTSSMQLRQGRQIDRMKLQPGDLVFFKNPKYSKSLHVGIFIEDDLFIHAPGKGRTVVQASLNSTYFKSNFIGARTFIR